MWMTTWLFPATILLLWFPVLPKALRAQGHLHLLQSLPPSGFGCPCQRSALVQGSTCLGQGSVWDRAVGSIHGTAQRCTPSPLLLVPVPILVPCYLNPDLASLTWCPASAGQTCSMAGDLPGLSGHLGNHPWTWSAAFVGLCAALQPLCSPARLAATQLPSSPPPGAPRQNLSLRNSAVLHGRVGVWCVLRALEPLGGCCKVPAHWAACWGRVNCTSRKREQYRWCFNSQY